MTPISILRRYRFRQFLLFLLLSVFLWALIRLSDSYITPIELKTSYVNIPREQVIISGKDAAILADIQASGFQLLRYKLFGLEVNVDASKAVKTEDSSYKLDLTEQYTFISQQLSRGVKLIQFRSSLLNIGISENIRKKIPVLPTMELSFEKDYDLFKPIQVEPDSIWVFGPKSVVDTLSKVSTEKLVITNISTNFEKDLFVNSNLENGLDVDIEKVHISAIVARFTEEKVVRELMLINVPKNTEVRLFPSQVELIYRVAFQDMRQINQDDFLVVCDFAEVQNNELKQIKPRLEKIPLLVKAVRINPPSVDFLIKE